MLIGKLKRRSIRLKGYDYSGAGAYFVTICTLNRECLFGEVVDGGVRLNQYGQVAQDEWLRSPQIRREIELDEWVIMPNHIHGIVSIREIEHSTNVGAHGRAPLHRKPRSLSSFIAGFKSVTTKRINEIRCTPRLPVWQRNYFEHVIRNEEELDRVRRYVQENSLKWDLDPENPHG